MSRKQIFIPLLFLLAFMFAICSADNISIDTRTRDPAQHPEFYRTTLTTAFTSYSNVGLAPDFFSTNPAAQSTVTLAISGTWADRTESLFLYVTLQAPVDSEEDCQSNLCQYPGLWLELPLADAALDQQGRTSRLTWSNVPFQDAFRTFQAKVALKPSLTATLLEVDVFLPLPRMSLLPLPAASVLATAITIKFPSMKKPSDSYVVTQNWFLQSEDLTVPSTAFSQANPVSLSLIKWGRRNDKGLKFEVHSERRNIINNSTTSKELIVALSPFTSMLRANNPRGYRPNACKIDGSDGIRSMFWNVNHSSNMASGPFFTITPYALDPWPRRVTITCAEDFQIYYPMAVFSVRLGQSMTKVTLDTRIGSWPDIAPHTRTLSTTALSSSPHSEETLFMNTLAIKTYNRTLTDQVRLLIRGNLDKGTTASASVFNLFPSLGGTQNLLATDLSNRMDPDNAKDSGDGKGPSIEDIVPILIGVFVGIVVLITVVVVIVCCCCCVGVAAAQRATSSSSNNQHTNAVGMAAPTTQPALDQYGQPIVYQDSQYPQNSHYGQQPQYGTQPLPQPQSQQQYGQQQYPQQQSFQQQYSQQPYPSQHQQYSNHQQYQPQSGTPQQQYQPHYQPQSQSVAPQPQGDWDEFSANFGKPAWDETQAGYAPNGA